MFSPRKGSAALNLAHGAGDAPRADHAPSHPSLGPDSASGARGEGGQRICQLGDCTRVVRLVLARSEEQDGLETILEVACGWAWTTSVNAMRSSRANSGS